MLVKIVKTDQTLLAIENKETVSKAGRERRATRRRQVKREEDMLSVLGIDYVKMGKDSGLDAMGMMTANYLTMQRKSLLCPITSELIHDPVHTADGHVFERDSIENWFDRGNATSPMTGLKLKNIRLVPAPLARTMKAQFLDSARQFRRLCKLHVSRSAAWSCSCAFHNRSTSTRCAECGKKRFTQKMNLVFCNACKAISVKRGTQATADWDDADVHVKRDYCNRRKCSGRAAAAPGAPDMRLAGGFRQGDQVQSLVDYAKQHVVKGDVGIIVGPCDAECADKAERVRADFGAGKGIVNLLAKSQIQHMQSESARAPASGALIH